MNNKFFIISFIFAILAVGLVYSVLPHSLRYFILNKAGERYVPITQQSHFDHMNVHAGRYREILDGNILSGEVDTHEHRDDPALWPLLSAAMLSPFLLITKSVFATFIISDFVFPVLIFIGFFLMIRSLTKNDFFALLSSFILMLFPPLPVLIPPSSFSELRNIFLQFLPVPIGVQTMSLNYLTRESFIPGGPFFLFSFFFTFKAISVEKQKSLFVLCAGIFYGLLFYLYLYFWVFVTIFLGLLFVILLFSRKNKQALAIFIITCIGLVVSIPFWSSHHNLVSLPNYAELINRAGLEIGHGVKWFLWKTYVLFIAVSFFAFWLEKKTQTKRPWYLFIIALALTQIAVYNINVVTGFFPQSDHWGNKVFLVTTGIIWAALIYYFLNYLQLRCYFLKFKKMFIVLISLLVLSLLSNVLYSQIILAKKEAHNYIVPANLMQSYEWLNKNTPVGSVVLSPSLKTNIDLSVYSHNRLFLARSQSTTATEEELLNRLNITYALFKIDPAYLDEMLQSHMGVFYFFTAKYNSQALDASLRSYKYYPLYQLPKELRKKILDDYSHFISPKKMPFKLDYLFVGPQEKDLVLDMQKLEVLDKIYDEGGVQIYKWVK